MLPYGAGVKERLTGVLHSVHTVSGMEGPVCGPHAWEDNVPIVGLWTRPSLHTIPPHPPGEEEMGDTHTLFLWLLYFFFCCFLMWIF